ncbi:MAG: N-acetyltransferase [Actinomycetota bacterium]|nr:N-acetyltransferase [Actinomycetota bacterium]
MSADVRRAEDGYEVLLDGVRVGCAFTEVHGHTVVFTHTEIDPAYEGRGLGGRLARAALDDVRARGEHVIARCAFIKGWIEKHPDYQDLLVSAR